MNADKIHELAEGIEFSATYSPEDNKLRLAADKRLPKELYTHLHSLGYRWAPKQACFVAPMWTPQREDILLQLCEEIGLEGVTLLERAEDRAARFEVYEGKRANEAKAAQEAVAQLTDQVPLGQPILVGHHSERAARRRAKRIDRGMREVVRLLSTAKYWEDRSKSTIRTAQYKHQPSVRAGRIRRLEADLRRCEKRLQLGAEVIGSDEAERQQRWSDHYQARLDYERAMLSGTTTSAEDAEPAIQLEDIKVGGSVKVQSASGAHDWFKVLRVNRRDGHLCSVSTVRRRAPIIGTTEILGYRPPEDGQAVQRVKAATRKPPLCNYPEEGCIRMTRAEWRRRVSGSAHVRVAEATPRYARHRVRSALEPGGRFRLANVFLTDAKVVNPPPSDLPSPPSESLARLPTLGPLEQPCNATSAPQSTTTGKYTADLAVARNNAEQGVQVIAAPQLFETPVELAKQMAELAGIEPGHRVLEPSAGTGRLLQAMPLESIDVVAIEWNSDLAAYLKSTLSNLQIKQQDFLETDRSELGKFDRIVMNPPFKDAQDIRHILYAWELLRPGGRLVAICADGPRQHKRLLPHVKAMGGTWQSLPADTFAQAGTHVRAALIVMERPALKRIHSAQQLSLAY